MEPAVRMLLRAKTLGCRDALTTAPGNRRASLVVISTARRALSTVSAANELSGIEALVRRGECRGDRVVSSKNSASFIPPTPSVNEWWTF